MEERIRNCYFLFLLLSLSTITACQSEKEETIKENKDDTPALLLINKKNTDNNKEVSVALKDKPKDSIVEKKENVQSIAKSKFSSKHQKLLNSLDKSVKIDYAPLDFDVIKNDTLIKSKKGTFHITYETSCINDSLVAQELFDFGQQYRKGYLISHNYRTNISIKLNGKTTGNKQIDKDLFKDKMDIEFLEKSIIKHPQFLRFDEEKNEAIFEFIVGVPNTDWLVVAGINLNEYGNIRIIDIVTPGM